MIKTQLTLNQKCFITIGDDAQIIMTKSNYHNKVKKSNTTKSVCSFTHFIGKNV